MFCTIFSHNKIFQDQIKNEFNNKQIRESKAYVITLNTKYEEIKKCFSKDYFVQFYLINEDHKIIKVYNENQIKSLFNKL